MNYPEIEYQVEKFLENFGLEQLPYKNSNINYLSSTSTFKIVNQDIQNSLKNNKLDAAIKGLIFLLENEICKLAASDILKTLAFLLEEYGLYLQALKVIELSRRAFDSYSPFFEEDYELHITRIKERIT